MFVAGLSIPRKRQRCEKGVQMRTTFPPALLFICSSSSLGGKVWVQGNHFPRLLTFDDDDERVIHSHSLSRLTSVCRTSLLLTCLTFFAPRPERPFGLHPRTSCCTFSPECDPCLASASGFTRSTFSASTGSPFSSSSLPAFRPSRFLLSVCLLCPCVRVTVCLLVCGRGCDA